MNAKHRMYSLPYNGTNPEWFLQEVEKRKKNIDHVYCELPHEEMLSHVRFTFDGKNYTKKTNSKGIAKLSTKSLKVGNHKVVITSANKYVKASKKTSSIKITK